MAPNFRQSCTPGPRSGVQSSGLAVLHLLFMRLHVSGAFCPLCSLTNVYDGQNSPRIRFPAHSLLSNSSLSCAHTLPLLCSSLVDVLEFSLCIPRVHPSVFGQRRVLKLDESPLTWVRTAGMQLTSAETAALYRYVHLRSQLVVHLTTYTSSFSSSHWSLIAVFPTLLLQWFLRVKGSYRDANL